MTLLRLSRTLLVTTGLLATTGVIGCLDRPVETTKPRSTSTNQNRLTQNAVDKIDILLAIDNSASMADKQAILALAVPDLVTGLVNPRCVNPEDPTAVDPNQPDSPSGSCSEGFERDFKPISNIHIGIISSSIGGHGSDSCGDQDAQSQKPCTETTGGVNLSNNDKGHLLWRTSPCTTSASDPNDPGAATYGDKGFLAWDPDKKLDPPGEGDITVLKDTLADMVTGVGQIGCGYEAQLESIYRFLADPHPYEKVSLTYEGTTSFQHLEGEDETLLQQRADFMRPDSLLAVIMLSDENDCSVKEVEGGQSHFATQIGGSFHLWQPRSECATDPNDECCTSCALSKKGCPEDATCKDSDGKTKTLAAEDDNINLRCFNQKQRFGIDFLYPVDRYVNALTQPIINPDRDDLSVKDGDSGVPNPIFTASDDTSSARDTGLVFLAAIVGVPWQDIARRDENGQPDLISGLFTTSSGEKQTIGGFMSFDELNAENDEGVTTWDVILGDPSTYKDPPADPLMVESIDPRSGTNPVTGDVLVTAAEVLAGAEPNPINGWEYPIPGKENLQYACIFPLVDARDCSADDPSAVSCDCSDPDNENPLCDETDKTLQVRAKAYPGTRQLQVLKGIQSQGIVASVCPAQLTDDNAKDYGYRPAIGAIIDRLKQALGHQCLPRPLTADKEGHVGCLILEAIHDDSDKSCSDYAGRQEVQEEHQTAKTAAQNDPIAATAEWNQFCEITQLSGDGLTSCQKDENTATGVDGWCYIDAMVEPQIGNPELVPAECPSSERRLLRFVGEGEPRSGATTFIICSGE